AARTRQAELAAQAAAVASASRSFSAPAAPAPVSAPASAPANVSRPSTPAPPPGSGAGTAVAWAYRELGRPYVWGAAGPDSFDCSGLTQYVWGKAGVSLDHYTGAQFNQGRRISVSELQPGDLIFFYSDLHHMGLYIGGGNMIHAPHTGDVVKISSIYYGGAIAGAVRVSG
ncbi:MAG: NlpC/P60 family protein, partial [Actinomycetota bacterium]|nr:NlpC/P60 family protein [Actinomycetota bacterium]